MFRFVALFEMKVVICEEMVMVLWANYFCLQFFLDVFVGVVKGGLVLPQLPIIIFIVEVLRTHMRALCHRVSKLVDHLLKTCLCFTRLLLLGWCISIDF